MNSESVKQEIANLLSEVTQPSRKQYPVAKHQIVSLTDLGIIDLMPAGFGYTDAATVIAAANDSGKANVLGDAVDYSNASALYTLLNEVEVLEPTMIVEMDETVVLLPNEDYSEIRVIFILNQPKKQTRAWTVKGAEGFAWCLDADNVGRDAKVFVSENPLGFWRTASTGWFGVDEWNTVVKNFALKEI